MAIEPEAGAGDLGQDRSGWSVWGPGYTPGEMPEPVGYPLPPGDGDILAGSPVHGAPGGGPADPFGVGRHGRRRRNGRRAAATVAGIAAIVVGLAGLGLSATRISAAMQPRKFTPVQQQQIMAWEVASRWRELPVGTLFPATTKYPAPNVLGGGSLTLATKRLGIAHQATCQEATDAAAATVLDRYGCQALLRATYVDGTGTYLVTIGVAAFSSAAQANTAQGALSDPRLTHLGQENALAPGVRAAAFPGTRASGFSDKQRQVSGSDIYGPYVVLYTIGYADSRPKVPVDVDGYTYGEMISMARGLTGPIGKKLSARPAVPRCPGAPGC